MVKANKDIPILEYLNSPELLADHRNHTVPILDKIPVPGSNDMTWIVMPLLLQFNDSWYPYQYVSEVVETVMQLLEVKTLNATICTLTYIILLQGLEFMHEHRIAHRYVGLCNSH